MLHPEFQLAALAWLLTYALHSALLLGTAWLVCSRGWVRSVRVKEILWRTALLGGLFSASVQTATELEPFGGLFVLQGISVNTEVGSGSSAPGAVVDHARPGAFLGTAVHPFEGSATSPRIAAGTLAGSSSAGFVWTEWALLGWALGGVALLSLLALASRRLRLAGRRRLAAGPLTQRLERLRVRAGLRRRVRLSVSEHLRAPVALGTFFPEICLPPRALDCMPGEQQECMLDHALGHLRRFDPFWLELGRTLQTLLFFQPLNRLATRRLAECAEFLCDEWAVEQTGDPLNLARCLTQVANWLVGDPRPLPVCAMTHLRSPLGERVERILDEDRPLDRAPGWLPPLAAGLLSATALLAPGFAAPAPSAPDLQPASDAGTRTVRLPRNQEPGRTLTPAVYAAPTSPLPSDSLREMWTSVTSELEALDTEIASLHSEVEGRAVPYRMRAKLHEIEQSARALFEKERKIRSLLDLWQGRTPNTVDARQSEESGDETR